MELENIVIKSILTIIQDGTIGDDLVVKPLPAALRSRLQQHKNDQIRLSGDFRDQDFDYMDVEASSDSLNVASDAHRRTNENDDYAFLDEDLLTDEDDDDVKESLQRNYRNNNPKKNSNRNFDSNNYKTYITFGR